ncbi:MAG: DUF4147 domain-containing protein [Candidatus Paceibacterota bacterium]|jgi:glycerate-2-kinase
MDRSIRNFESLAENELRLSALAIAEAGYAAIDVGAALIRKLHIENDELHINDTRFRLAGRRVFFVGVGKCAVAAAETIETLLGDRLTGGIALDVASSTHSNLTKIETLIGTHPLPSEANETATERIISLLSGCTGDDLVIMLISGGGSTLLCLNKAPMTCVDESMLFSSLTARGASIQDINTVRKHTSFARGGGLAKTAYPAEVISLIVSDVPDNDIGFIASGPTVRDTSTIEDARAILKRYDVLPSEGFEFLETPKDQKYFDHVDNILFLTNQDALFAMREESARRGYTATIMDDHVTGEAAQVGRTIVEALHSAPSKSVLLYAGESTVTVKGRSGAGGRNQEMALSALEHLHPNELLLPLASDGHDNTDHAGAIADATTRAHADAHNLSIREHLDVHASYDFFTTSGDAVLTGYTGSNVSDIIIAIKD